MAYKFSKLKISDGEHKLAMHHLRAALESVRMVQHYMNDSGPVKWDHTSQVKKSIHSLANKIARGEFVLLSKKNA